MKSDGESENEQPTPGSDSEFSGVTSKVPDLVGRLEDLPRPARLEVCDESPIPERPGL